MTTPVLPEPDDKDWTWVLSEPCPDCGFDARRVQRAEVPDLTGRFTKVIRESLARPDAAIRPEPAVWAPVEYGCHVRDVCRLFLLRLQLMLDEDDPLFDNWDQDVTAVEGRYWQQQPAAVAVELGGAADAIADRFARVQDDQWARSGRRSNGSMFTVESFAGYFLHDLAHHAWDVTESAAR